MSYTDVPSCHKEITHVAGIQATIRHRSRIDAVVDGFGLEFLAGETFRILRVCKVEVDAPSGSKSGILMENGFLYVVLFIDVVSEQASGFSFAGYVSYPLKTPVRIEAKMVLQVTPI